MNLSDLKKPFPPELIQWRIGSYNHDKTKGQALAYIDARMVADRLDEVCGPENWQKRFPESPIEGAIVCEIGILCPLNCNDSAGPSVQYDWVWKADGADKTQVEAEKGGLSDAFKRAGVAWGIARYLYDLPLPWIDIQPTKNGKSYYIPDETLEKLAKALAKKFPLI